LLAAVAALASMGAGGGWAQDAAAGGVAPAKVMARDVDPDWEVATVKPSDPDEKHQSFRVSGRHVLIERETVETMLVVGYNLQRNQIVGAPDWAKTEDIDVDGVPDVDGQPNVKQFQSLVRKLMVERFGLKMHMEQRPMEVYALTVTKDGPKFAQSKSDPGSLPDQEVRGDQGFRTLEFTNVSMADFSLMMLTNVERPLVDQTGLKGRYDFKLKYTYDEEHAPTDGSAPAGLFTAIQEQLGLKLEPVKAMAPVMVVDWVEKPSAN
jgi:uncharacterized protein (TIGR03435 family)